jgi:hypothetical protein
MSSLVVGDGTATRWQIQRDLHTTNNQISKPVLRVRDQRRGHRVATLSSQHVFDVRPLRKVRGLQLRL